MQQRDCIKAILIDTVKTSMIANASISQGQKANTAGVPAAKSSMGSMNEKTAYEFLR